MPQKKMTADEILDELKRDQKVTVDEKGAPSVDMGRIDDLIRDILTKNKEQELKKTSDQFTAQEKEEIEKEVRVQTNSLTRKLQKNAKGSGKSADNGNSRSAFRRAFGDGADLGSFGGGSAGR